MPNVKTIKCLDNKLNVQLSCIVKRIRWHRKKNLIKNKRKKILETGRLKIFDTSYLLNTILRCYCKST